MNCCKLIKCRYQFAGIGYWAQQAVLDKLLRELHLGARGRKIALRWREEVRRELPPQVLNVHRLCDVAQPRYERTDALILFLYSFLVLQINLLPDGDSITQSPRHEGWACRPKVKVRIGLIIVSVMCHADQTEMSKTISQNAIIAVGERWWKWDMGMHFRQGRVGQGSAALTRVTSCGNMVPELHMVKAANCNWQGVCGFAYIIQLQWVHNVLAPANVEQGSPGVSPAKRATH